MLKAVQPLYYQIAQFACIAICTGFVACTESYSTKNSKAERNPTIKPPVTIASGAPRIVKIDTCPPLFSVTRPEKDSAMVNVYLGNTTGKILITHEKVRPADFFIPMKVYNMDKGLSINAIMSGYEDKTGNLWFGTHGGGVTRYDGKSSVTFTADEGLGNNAVVNTIEDKEGNIWFSLDGGGIARYDGRTITKFTKSNGLMSDEVRSIIFDKNGDLLLATRTGLSRYNHNFFYNYTDPAFYYRYEFTNSLQDDQGNFWFGTREGGVNCYNGKTLVNYSMKQGLADNLVSSSYKDHKGNLWFGTRTGALSKFDGTSFTTYENYEAIPKYNSIHSIGEDMNGNMWFGTFKSGVVRYDGKQFKGITTSQGLAHDIVNSITRDKSGNLWLGTYGGGANCYAGDAFTIFTTQQGLADNTVRNIIQDKDGVYWFGTNAGGVSRYDGKTFTTYSAQQGINNNRVNRVMQDSKGNMWFCNGGGACRYNGKTFDNFTQWQGLAYDAVRCIVEDPAGNIWFGTEKGLSKYDGKYFYNYTKTQGLPSSNVRDMLLESSGQLWLGTHESGLALFDEKTVVTLDTSQGLVNNFIFNLTKDSHGNIWVCTGDGGISILRNAEREKLLRGQKIDSTEKIFENFTVKQGLSDNVVYDVAEDRQGNIFIGTNMGLTVVRGGLQENPITKDQLEYYSIKNGYPIADANTQSMYTDRDGIIWIGTGNKLVRLDYAAIRKDPNPPNVRIRRIEINNEKISWYNLQSKRKQSENIGNAITLEEKTTFGRALADAERDSMYKKFGDIEFDSIARFYPLPANLVLPHRHNNITFDFAAIEPARPEFIKYQFMLDGYDNDWGPVTENAYATFGNISKGNYTFKVKAMSPDGVWSKPVSYTFSVLPPWYQSFWAYLLYAAAAILTLYSAYRWRVGQLHKKQSAQLQTVIATQEEERKRISRDLHDDVGTKLSALKLFLSSLKTNIEKSQYQQVEQLAANSEQLINETIKDVREMLLNLSPGVLEEFGFTVAIEGLVSKINQTGTINFELSVFGFTGSLKREYELALYRITQELINNVLKHSAAKNVSLQIGYRDENIVIMIEDDGQGFDVEAHREGYGLKNLAARTKLLHGTINIDSKPGKGTSVAIEVPYKFS